MVKVENVVQDGEKLYILYREQQGSPLLKCDVSGDAQFFKSIMKMDTADIPVGGVDRLVLLKTYNPELCLQQQQLYDEIYLDVDDWLMFNNKPLCRLSCKGGNWTKQGDVYCLLYEKSLYVLRPQFKRHKQDKEVKQLTINTTTGVCKISCKEFKKNYCITYNSVWDTEKRCWCRKLISQEDIISVKRH